MLFLEQRGIPLATMALADGVFRTTMVALEFPLGVIGDRIGRKRTYLAIAGVAVLTYAGIASVDGPGMLFPVWALWGASWALSSGASSSYAYELIVRAGEEERSVEVLGFLRAVGYTAILASHLAAGLLFSLEPALPFVVSGLFALAALALASTLPDIERPAPGTGPGVLDAPRSIFALLAGNRALAAAAALMALAVVYYWSPRIVMQPLLVALGLGPIGIGGAYFLYSLAGALAGLSAAPLRSIVGVRSGVLLGFASLWLGATLVAVAPGRTAVLFLPLLSFGYGIVRVILEAFMHERMGNRHRASVLSAASFLGGAVMIVSRPQLALLADATDPRTAFMAWAALGLVVAVAIFALAGPMVRGIEPSERDAS